jgi:hypothetical protein
VRYNRFENIGYHGIQTFGSASTFAYNVFDHTCASKGDGGAINTFGNGSLAPGRTLGEGWSGVHDYPGGSA